MFSLLSPAVQPKSAFNNTATTYMRKSKAIKEQSAKVISSRVFSLFLHVHARMISCMLFVDLF